MPLPPCARSLYQNPRSGLEAVLFLPGLRASNIWYGHQDTVIWMQTELPAGFAEAMAAQGLALDYEGSGWCFVESGISAAVKLAGKRLDLAFRNTLIYEGGGPVVEFAYGPDEPSVWAGYRLTEVCSRSRFPPLLPEEADTLLRNEKKFTSASDVDKVSELYRSFFESIVQCTSVSFRLCGWGAVEVAGLAKVLPRFAMLQSLDLGENKLDPEAAKALAPAIAVGASVTQVSQNPN